MRDKHDEDANDERENGAGDDENSQPECDPVTDESSTKDASDQKDTIDQNSSESVTDEATACGFRKFWRADSGNSDHLV